MWRIGRAVDEEGMRMILAFFSIKNPVQRLRLIELAEAFATGTLREGSDGLAVQDNAAEQPER